MRFVMMFLLMSFTLAAAAENDCWRFRDASDPQSQLRSLTLEIRPSTGPSEDVQVGEVHILRNPGAAIDGQLPCRKLSSAVWQCQAQDDRGSFKITVKGDVAELSTTYLYLGDEKDSLEFTGDESDPWVLEGRNCKSSKKSH
jgi:hypothetical protein